MWTRLIIVCVILFTGSLVSETIKDEYFKAEIFFFPDLDIGFDNEIPYSSYDRGIPVTPFRAMIILDPTHPESDYSVFWTNHNDWGIHKELSSPVVDGRLYFATIELMKGKKMEFSIIDITSFGFRERLLNLGIINTIKSYYWMVIGENYTYSDLTMEERIEKLRQEVSINADN